MKGYVIKDTDHAMIFDNDCNITLIIPEHVPIDLRRKFLKSFSLSSGYYISDVLDENGTSA